MSCWLVVPIALGSSLVKIVLLLMKTSKATMCIEELKGAREWIQLLFLWSTDKLIKQVSIFLTLHSIGASLTTPLQELTLKGLILELFDFWVDLV